MHKLSILYSWFIRLSTKFLPDIPSLMRFRGFLYSLMMNECGKNFQVCSTAYINSLHTLKIGSDVYLAHNCVILGKNVTIEDEVLVGPNTVIVSGNHTLKNNSYRFGKSEIKPILIGKGSWIGANCTILAGAIIPTISVIAAGSVVTKELDESYSVYAGSPARFIKVIEKTSIS